MVIASSSSTFFEQLKDLGLQQNLGDLWQYEKGKKFIDSLNLPSTQINQTRRWLVQFCKI